MVALAVLVFGCGETYPSCPVDVSGSSGEYVPPAPDPEPNPDPPVPPGEPGPFGADAEEGYRRLGDGQVCRCQLGSLMCSAEEPTTSEGDKGSEGKEGNGIDFRDADQQTPSICGNVYWCCMSLRCVNEDGTKYIDKVDAMDVHICSKSYGQPDTKDGAYAAWQVRTNAELKVLQVKHGNVCAIYASSCYEDPHKPMACGNYPF
jgi:hypothetical protein